MRYQGEIAEVLQIIPNIKNDVGGRGVAKSCMLHSRGCIYGIECVKREGEEHRRT